MNTAAQSGFCSIFKSALQRDVDNWQVWTWTRFLLCNVFLSLCCINHWKSWYPVSLKSCSSRVDKWGKKKHYLLFYQQTHSSNDNEADWGLTYVAAGCATISNSERSWQENCCTWTWFGVAVNTAHPTAPCFTHCTATRLTLDKGILLNQVYFKMPQEKLYYKCEVLSVMYLPRQWIFSNCLSSCIRSIFNFT